MKLEFIFSLFKNVISNHHAKTTYCLSFVKLVRLNTLTSFVKENKVLFFSNILLLRHLAPPFTGHHKWVVRNIFSVVLPPLTGLPNILRHISIVYIIHLLH